MFFYFFDLRGKKYRVGLLIRIPSLGFSLLSVDYFLRVESIHRIVGAELQGAGSTWSAVAQVKFATELVQYLAENEEIHVLSKKVKEEKITDLQ